MAYISDATFDSGLTAAIASVSNLLICSADPGGVYATATAAKLGSEGTLSTTGPVNATSGTGRQIAVNAITSGTINGTGVAGFWAWTDGVDTVIADGPLSATQAVTSGNTFTLDKVSVFIRDASAV